MQEPNKPDQPTRIFNAERERFNQRIDWEKAKDIARDLSSVFTQGIEKAKNGEDCRQFMQQFIERTKTTWANAMGINPNSFKLVFDRGSHDPWTKSKSKKTGELSIHTAEIDYINPSRFFGPEDNSIEDEIDIELEEFTMGTLADSILDVLANLAHEIYHMRQEQTPKFEAEIPKWDSATLASSNYENDPKYRNALGERAPEGVSIRAMREILKGLKEQDAPNPILIETLEIKIEEQTEVLEERGTEPWVSKVYKAKFKRRD